MTNNTFLNWFDDPANKAQDLAAHLGVTNGTVTTWKQGVTPRASFIEGIHSFTAGAVPFWSWFSPNLLPPEMQAK